MRPIGSFILGMALLLPSAAFAGDAEAAIVPEHIARQYPNLIEVTRSREFPGTILSAGPDVPAEVRQAVQDALLTIHEDESAYNVLVEIGASAFRPASADDYNGAQQILSGFFGYQAEQETEQQAEQ